jgi:hypothetical protein
VTGSNYLNYGGDSTFRDPSENIKVRYGTATTLSVKQGLVSTENHESLKNWQDGANMAASFGKNDRVPAILPAMQFIGMLGTMPEETTNLTEQLKQALGAMFVPGGSKTKPSNNGGMIRVLDECRRCKGSVRVA